MVFNPSLMQKVLFLDRDGVINVEKDYLYKIEDFEFIDGIMDLCHYYQSESYKIIVVTNQSGIAREYYNEVDFSILSLWMVEEFAKFGVTISAVYHCPHHPSISGICDCRKPNPGMLIEANKKFSIDFENSLIIGDKERDIEAGLNAGLRESYLFNEDMSIKESRATKIVSKLEDIWK